MMRGYLLSVKGLSDSGCREKALGLVDPARREKALRCAAPEDCARSLGAGLLLRYGLREWGDGDLPGGIFWQEITLEALLRESGPAFSPVFRCGPGGKPYLAEGEPYFSLSHSGAYAMCVFSDREVGADLQQMRKADADRLAGRFFSAAERALIAAAETDGEKQALFYRLWTRKEALGKLTGEGAAGVLALDVGIGPRTAGLSGAAGAPGLVGESRPRMPEAQAEVELKWVEYGFPEGYRIAVCFHAGC